MGLQILGLDFGNLAPAIQPPDGLQRRALGQHALPLHYLLAHTKPADLLPYFFRICALRENTHVIGQGSKGSGHQ
jgi:hypothetical protein